MMSRTFGAPLGGTSRGGHQVFEPWRVSLITPPNFGSGAGSCLPLTVVVALGEPNTPVTCCAATGTTASVAASRAAASSAPTAVALGVDLMLYAPLQSLSCGRCDAARRSTRGESE